MNLSLGKSFLSYDLIGQLHKDYPKAIAIKFNTEMREQTQFNQRVADEFGIDTERYIAINDNDPAGIFDVIEKQIAEACENGDNIKLIIIDSVTDIMGRRAKNATTVDTQQIGDRCGNDSEWPTAYSQYYPQTQNCVGFVCSFQG